MHNRGKKVQDEIFDDFKTYFAGEEIPKFTDDNADIAFDIMWNVGEVYNQLQRRYRAQNEKMIQHDKELYRSGTTENYEIFAKLIDKDTFLGEKPAYILSIEYDDSSDTRQEVIRSYFRHFIKEYTSIIPTKINPEDEAKIISIDARNDNMIDFVKRYCSEGKYKDKCEILWDESGKLDELSIFKAKDFIIDAEPLLFSECYLFYVGPELESKYDDESAEQILNKRALKRMDTIATDTLSLFQNNKPISDTTLLVAELIRAFSAGKYCAVGSQYEDYVGSHEMNRYSPPGPSSQHVFTFIRKDEQLFRDYKRLIAFRNDMEIAAEIWNKVMEDTSFHFELNEKHLDKLFEAAYTGDETALKKSRANFEDVQVIADALGITEMIDAVLNHGIPLEDVLA